MPQPAQYAQAEAPKATATIRIIRLTVNRAVTNLRPRSFPCLARRFHSNTAQAACHERFVVFTSAEDEGFLRLGKNLDKLA
jgi:hypothetical protein